MLPLIKDTRGQATVEAAFLLPTLLVIFGLLLEPTLLLYNRSVMNAAATEGCRLAATAMQEDDVKAFVRRRLGAIPNLCIFHKGSAASYRIECSTGDDGTSVSIEHEVTTLPLLGISAGLIAQASSENEVKQSVSAQISPTPEWLSSTGKNAQDWIATWK